MSIGIYLIGLATRWGCENPSHLLILHVLIGLTGGLLIRKYGFSRIVNQNVGRIESMDGRASIFAFQAVSSYLLVIVMMLMGIYIRQSAFLPIAMKIPGYYSIGWALLSSSAGYYRAFFDG